MGYYNNKDIWQYVLPDGSSFCNWGGKKSSRNIIRSLDIKKGNRIIDICSGQSGTYELVKPNKSIELYGIDISKEAIKNARDKFSKRQEIKLVVGNAKKMIFPNEFFDKAFSQDPDVFLEKNKLKIFKEISRILKPGGLFILQIYVISKNIARRDKKRLENILKKIGYSNQKILVKENIKTYFLKSGFILEKEESLHKMYIADNQRMIDNLENKEKYLGQINSHQTKDLKKLFLLEKELFKKGAFTGMLFIGRKK